MNTTDATPTVDPRELHIPVLRDRCVALLAPALQDAGSVYLDATTGLGGHSEAVLTACPAARAICLDRDREALALAAQRLAAFAGRTTFVQTVFDGLGEAVAAHGRDGRVDAILFDLGVSSLQLDSDVRGFAYSRPAPLDMRMDRTTGSTAADLVNSLPEAELRRTLRVYGEEPHARAYARAIVAHRAEQPLTTTDELAGLIIAAAPRGEHRGHPAKRVFQALRIAVNDELGAIERALPAAIRALRPGGRLVVMSFQSLEDRIVKRCFAAGASVSAPPDMPVVRAQDEPVLRPLTRGAEQADAAEVAANPRAASVRLRAVEKLREAA